MARQGVRLNRRAVGNLLKSDAVARVVNEAAARIAAEAGENAEVEQYTTDREAAAVLVPAEEQARDGTLTRAAAAAGYEVKQKP
jgi:hypothetical protein